MSQRLRYIEAVVEYWLMTKPGLIAARSREMCLWLAHWYCERRTGKSVDRDEFELVLSNAREGRPRQFGPNDWRLEISEWGYAKSKFSHMG